MSVGIKAEVKGLKEMQKALKSLDLQKGLQKTNKAVVNRIVVPEAKRLGQRSMVNLAGNATRLGTRGVASIRGGASQTKAHILAGKKSVPYYAGYDFGSSGRYRQFPRAKKGGRILYQAIENKHDEMIARWLDDAEDLLRDAFPD